jgi:hypothetical protein
MKCLRDARQRRGNDRGIQTIHKKGGGDNQREHVNFGKPQTQFHARCAFNFAPLFRCPDNTENTQPMMMNKRPAKKFSDSPTAKVASPLHAHRQPPLR